MLGVFVVALLFVLMDVLFQNTWFYWNVIVFIVVIVVLVFVMAKGFFWNTLFYWCGPEVKAFFFFKYRLVI